MEAGRLFCADCYGESYGATCGGCGNKIGGGQLWVEALDQQWHSQCFICTVSERGGGREGEGVREGGGELKSERERGLERGRQPKGGERGREGVREGGGRGRVREGGRGKWPSKEQGEGRRGGRRRGAKKVEEGSKEAQNACRQLGTVAAGYCSM